MTYANRRVFVVVPAAGCGSRMQSDRPKQYLPLGRSGQTVLQTTVLALLDVPVIDGIYVAVSPEDEYAETLAIPAAVLRTGGKTRAETVYQTLEALSDTIADDDLVLVHDAARPFVTPKTIEDCIACVKAYGSAVCALLGGGGHAAAAGATIPGTMEQARAAVLAAIERVRQG